MLGKHFFYENLYVLKFFWWWTNFSDDKIYAIKIVQEFLLVFYFYTKCVVIKKENMFDEQNCVMKQICENKEKSCWLYFSLSKKNIFAWKENFWLNIHVIIFFCDQSTLLNEKKVVMTKTKWCSRTKNCEKL